MEQHIPHGNMKLDELRELIERAIRGHIPQMTVPAGTTQDDVYQCIRSIMRENPDIFWFSHQWSYAENDLTIRFQYTISPERSTAAKGQIEDVIQNDFQIGHVLQLSAPERIMYVYKWLALYCQYNIYSAYNQTIYSVFVCRNSVCTGYAKAAQYLLKLLGIESRLVFGTLPHAEEGSRHCWLMVKVNDQWYHTDPTFAVPGISDLLIKAGVIPIFGADGLVYNYFCCDTESIKSSRMLEDENELPVCTSMIDFRPLQDIPVHLHRTNGTEQQGVKGCMLSNAGVFSTVYLWHSGKRVQSVVKIYKDDSDHERLRHELRMIRQLNPSSHVLHVLGVTDQQDGLIIEQATPLADLLCSHYFQLSAVSFCQLLLDVLAGLQDCLKYGVYYRDIHLNNIYRTSEGRYVLGDFGSCVWIDNDKTSKPSGVGSPWYLAPETYLRGDFNEESATYGVGMLAYFLLNVFYPPFWIEYGKASLNHRMSGKKLLPPVLLKNPRGAFEQQLGKVIEKSLSFITLERYRKLSDMEDAIRQCLSLVEGNDYRLIDGGSSERMPQLAEDKTIISRAFPEERTCAPCACAPAPPPPPRRSYDSRRDRVDDFASTAVGPVETVRNSPNTYMPRAEMADAGTVSPKQSIWSKLFGRKKAVEDMVYSSVFAPAEIKLRSHLIVQVYLHLQEETETVSSLAVETDGNATRRDYRSLPCKLKHGDQVEVQLNIFGETLLMTEKQSLVWQGSFTKCSFDYFVPRDLDVEELSCMALLSVNGIPAGKISFITKIVEAPRQLNPEVIVHSFNKVFISYAHKDEERVRSFHEGLKLAGVEHFFDRAYLKTGDVFPQVIQDYINSADLFVLFWSENAAQSEYVAKERQQALERAFPQVKPQQAAKLSIYPMSIEPRAELPCDMKDNYHFGEM